MTARRLGPEDLDWLVEALRRRRDGLVPHAPVFWRPAPDARARHRDWMGHVLGAAGGLGWHTGGAALVAAPEGDGWLLDDVVIPDDDDWAGAGTALWDALVSTRPGDAVCFVCPVPEPARLDFARRQGLVVQRSWWLRELDGTGGGRAGAEVVLTGGTTARAVAAPPVYAPPGPVLLVSGPVHDAGAVAAAVEEAPSLGCAAVVVERPAGDDGLGAALADAGFRRHCDFLVGRLGRPAS